MSNEKYIPPVIDPFDEGTYDIVTDDAQESVGLSQEENKQIIDSATDVAGTPKKPKEPVKLNPFFKNIMETIQLINTPEKDFTERQKELKTRRDDTIVKDSDGNTLILDTILKNRELEKIEPEKDSEISSMASMGAGIVDATIKIPYGFVSLGAQVIESLEKDDIPIDQGAVARLEKYFKDSIIGKIGTIAEEDAYKTASGTLTTIFAQLYATSRMGAAGGLAIANRVKPIVDGYFKAAKLNKVVTPSKYTKQAIEKTRELNKLSGGKKFATVVIGGGVGTALVADVEKIGNFGDLIGGPSLMDREEKLNSRDDAIRKLTNRFKFGAENTVLSVPFAYGLKYIGNKLATQSKDIAFSDSQLDRWIDKWIRSTVDSRGKLQVDLSEGVKRSKGKTEAAQLTAKDMVLDINKAVAEVVKNSRPLTNGGTAGRIVGKLDELLTQGDDVVKGDKIVFEGFDNKKLKEVTNYFEEFGIKKNEIDILTDSLFKVRQAMSVFKNAVLQGKNLNVGAKEFNNIMSNRFKNFFNSEYKIFTDKNMFGFNAYKPNRDSLDAVKEVIKKNAKAAGETLSDVDLDIIANDIVKSVRFDSMTKSPRFTAPIFGMLEDAQTQIVNIGENMVGGSFKATPFVTSKADLKAFNRLFGETRDIRNTIFNYTHDLGQIVSRDYFHNNILKTSNELIKSGERAIVYPTRLAAQRAFGPNADIITDPNGLQIKSPLGGDSYTNPLNGMFTTKEYADALNFATKLPFEGASKSALYRNLVMIPKGMAQISKTVLGPFTHTRNFATAGTFVSMNGNFFKNPLAIIDMTKRAFNTVQPQYLYRNKQGSMQEGQKLYEFLLGENVVSSSATYRDTMGLIDDIGKGGDIFGRVFDKLGLGLNKIYKFAQDMYLAEDDIFKVYSFFAEYDNLVQAHRRAIQNGVIKSMPKNINTQNYPKGIDPLLIEAADIVKNTVPNYNQVGSLVEASRRSPLGNFVSFASEMIRTSGNSVGMSLKHMEDPIRRPMAIRRMTGNATTLVGLGYVLPELARVGYGISRNVVAAMREFLPSFSESSMIIPYIDEEGNYRYIDGDAAFPYNVVTNPMQSIVAGMERERVFNPEGPLIKGFAEGTIKAVGRLVRPYVDESIWISTALDIFTRGGRTKPTKENPEGRRLWNPLESTGNQIKLAMEYATEKLSPGSAKQLQRLYQAAFDIPGKYGEKYEVPEELAGFYGMRGVKLDPKKRIKFKIAEFQRNLSNARQFLTADTSKGSEVSSNQIIQAFYKANKARYDVTSKMRRVYDAAKVLKMKEKDVFIEFNKRGQKSAYGFIKNNKYRPLDLTKGFQQRQIEIKENLEDEFSNQKFNFPLDRKTYRIIGKMQRDMYKLRLNKNFEEQIQLENYLIPEERSDLPSNAAPLPLQPEPNQQVLNTPMPAQGTGTQNGLTPSEMAYLSPEEQAIRLRGRGIV